MRVLRISFITQGKVYEIYARRVRQGDLYGFVEVQEILFEKTRVNTPGVVGPENWTYRLPKPISELASDEAVLGRFDRIRRLVEASGRA